MKIPRQPVALIGTVVLIALACPLLAGATSATATPARHLAAKGGTVTWAASSRRPSGASGHRQSDHRQLYCQHPKCHGAFYSCAYLVLLGIYGALGSLLMYSARRSWSAIVRRCPTGPGTGPDMEQAANNTSADSSLSMRSSIVRSLGMYHSYSFIV
jgi:hypothetical protein